MKTLGACLLVLLLLAALVPSRALYLNRNNLEDPEESAQQPRPANRLTLEELRQLGLIAGRQRRSRLPLCKRVQQELPPVCANDVECQRHYLQYVNNMVRMMDAGRRRRR